MKKIIVTAMLLIMSMPVFAHDAELKTTDYAAPAKSALAHDRKGFVLGVGAGVGEQFLYYSTFNRQNTVPMIDLKLGYGVTDKILVLFNPNIIFSNNDGFQTYLMQFPIAAQFYVIKDFYLRPGVGLSISTRSYDAFLRAQALSGKASVGANLAVGYEFRLMKGRLGLSPELVYHYDRISSGFNTVQSNTIGLQVSLLSFFNVQ